MRDRGPSPLRMLVVACAYFALARGGLLLASVGNEVTLLWPPSGLALGALVLWGPSMAIAVWVGALSANLMGDTTVAACLLIATGNAAAALVGERLMRWRRVQPTLSRLEDVSRFGQIAAISCTVAAIIGTTTLVLTETLPAVDAPQALLTWWMGDLTGVLLCAPLVMILGSRSTRITLAELRGSPSILGVLCVLSAVLTFGLDGEISTLFAVLTLVFLLAAGSTGGLLAATLPAVGATAAAMWGLWNQTGFLAPVGDRQALYTWGTATFMAVGSLIVASLQAENRRSIRAQADLEAQALEARRLEAISLVAAGVAHEFNNLLQVIQGNAEVARRQAPDPTPLDRIRFASRRGARLCAQLKDFVGEGVDEPGVLDLGAELTGLAAERDAHSSDDIQVVFSANHIHAPVKVGRDRLRQILDVLLDNATEAAASQPDATITLSLVRRDLAAPELSAAPVCADAAQPGSYVGVRVTDDGPGMPPDVAARLFEPFFTTHMLGRGLGLASLAGIVRRQGGVVQVETSPGAGTSVWVGWPERTDAVAGEAARA